MTVWAIFEISTRVTLCSSPSEYKERVSLAQTFLTHVCAFLTRIGCLGHYRWKVAVVVDDRIDDATTFPDDVALVLAPTRPRYKYNSVVMMPDFYFIQSRAYTKLKTYVPKHDTGWDRKQDGAVWRGTTTGARLPSQNARITFYRKNSSVADLGFTQLCYEEHRGLPVVPQESVERQLTRKYQVDLAGHSCSWDGLFWKLLSKSTTLRVKQRDEQWYHARLRPWVHFVPCTSRSFSRRLEWCRRHPETCRAISAAATRVAANMTYFGEVEKFAKVLKTRLDLRSRGIERCVHNFGKNWGHGKT